MARGKTNELEDELTDGQRIKTPKLDLTEEQYDFLAGHLIGTRDMSLEQVMVIKQRNPDFQYTDYTSSTYLKHWPVDEIERDYMMHLAMCPAAVLDSFITMQATEFYLAPYIFPENDITQWYLNEIKVKEEWLEKEDGSYYTLNDLIPIFPTVIKEGWSESAREFLFFIRIDDELMRVDEWDPETGRIRVLRGFNGSSPASHEKGDVVTSPIYNGNGPLSEHVIFFGGKQAERLASALEKPDRELYYCSDKGPENIPILERKAKEILETMEDKGVDGTALDVMSASLPMFKMVNALGLETVPWNFAKNQPYSNADWVVGHDRMIGVIQQYIHERVGRWPVLQANGVRNHNFEEGEGNGGYSKQLLIPTDLKQRPLDAYHTETGVAACGENFPEQFRMFQTAFREDLAVSFAMKAVFLAQNQTEYDRTMVYSSAFFYLAYEPKEGERDIIKDGTGPVLRASYLSAFFHLPSVGPTWTHPYGGLTYKMGLPYTMFLPLGKPLETHEAGNLDAYRYEDSNVFMRRYENGLVLINPTSKKGELKFEGNEGAEDQDIGDDLAGPLSEPSSYTVELDRRYIDSQTGEFIEGSISLPPLSGKILLIDGGVLSADAYITSDTYTINQESYTIDSVLTGTPISEFMSNIGIAPGATVSILDENQSPADSGNLAPGFTIVVISENGLTEAVYTINFYAPDSIPGFIVWPVQIYPNPAFELITIDGLNAPCRIEIVNINGSTVRMLENHEAKKRILSIKELQAGIYFIKISHENSYSAYCKFIKK
jgi:hypothetical protein